jgi:hypothetical protein
MAQRWNTKARLAKEFEAALSEAARLRLDLDFTALSLKALVEFV